MRLQLKLLLGFVLVTGGAMAAAAWFSHHQALASEYRHMQGQARMLTAVFGHFALQAPGQDGAVLAQAAPGTPREPASIDYRSLAQGEPGEPVTRRALAHFRADVMAGEYVEPLANVRQQGFFYYAEPRRAASGQLQGVLEVSIPWQRVAGSIQREQLSSLLTDMLLGGLAVLLYFLVRCRLVSRVECLQRQLQLFGEGDRTARASVRGDDELAGLARSFNKVADTLVSKQKQLAILDIAIEQSPVSIIITDAKGRIQYTNQKFTALSGYQAEEVRGKTPRIFKSGYTTDDEYSRLWKTIKSGQVWRGEFLNCKKNGEFFWERATISPVLGADGVSQHFIAIKEDVNELKEFEKSLELKTYYDSLTGLPNQAMFEERVRVLLESGEAFAVAIINLDGFQKVNLSHTHAGGDMIIRDMAERLKGMLKMQDILARLAADEFALLLPGKDNLSIHLVLQHVLDTLRMPFRIGNEQVFVTGRVGVAFCPADGPSFEALRRNVFSALHRAKQAGGDKICFFQQELDDEIIKVFARESELRQALERDEFELYYQPQVYSGQVRGVEALLRWNSQKYGMVAPDDFIPLAEQSGLIVDIGRWVLETACRQALS